MLNNISKIDLPYSVVPDEVKPEKTSKKDVKGFDFISLVKREANRSGRDIVLGITPEQRTQLSAATKPYYTQHNETIGEINSKTGTLINSTRILKMFSRNIGHLCLKIEHKARDLASSSVSAVKSMDSSLNLSRCTTEEELGKQIAEMTSVMRQIQNSFEDKIAALTAVTDLLLLLEGAKDKTFDDELGLEDCLNEIIDSIDASVISSENTLTRDNKKTEVNSEKEFSGAFDAAALEQKITQMVAQQKEYKNKAIRARLTQNKKDEEKYTELVAANEKIIELYKFLKDNLG